MNFNGARISAIILIANFITSVYFLLTGNTKHSKVESGWFESFMKCSCEIYGWTKTLVSQNTAMFSSGTEVFGRSLSVWCGPFLNFQAQHELQLLRSIDSQELNLLLTQATSSNSKHKASELHSFLHAIV